MALYWAWDFSIAASKTQYVNAGWSFGNSLMNTNASGSPFPRHPIAGYGGMAKGCYNYSGGQMETASWPSGALTDGQIQFHFYGGFGNTGARIKLLASDGTTLLELRPATSTASPQIEVYSGEGTQTLRGTTTGTITSETWNVLGIRFKVGTTGAEIAISINGSSETILSNGNSGATSGWAKLQFFPSGSTVYITGITVWDDGANDDALTTTRWIASVRPSSDSSIGSWEDESAGTTNIYQSVDDDPLSTSDYCTTATDLDELRFGVDTDDINAGWAPDTIDGVAVVASMRGDGTLSTGQTVIDDGTNNALGSSHTLTGTSLFGTTNDVFPKQADGSTDWTKAAINAHSFGVKVS